MGSQIENSEHQYMLDILLNRYPDLSSIGGHVISPPSHLHKITLILLPLQLILLEPFSMAPPSIPSHPAGFDPLELEILNRREAFNLPPKDVCYALVKIFFEWIAPILPVVNRQDFMRKYHSPDEAGPPILLLQAMLMVAARFTVNQQSSDDRSISPRVFYRKTKALYDAGYEKNPVTILQAVILLGIYWDGPDGMFFSRGT